MVLVIDNHLYKKSKIIEKNINFLMIFKIIHIIRCNTKKDLYA